MNKLSASDRVQILSMLVEGMSMLSVSHAADVSINTVRKLLVEAGTACAAYHDEHVVNFPAKHIQCDATWFFGYAEEKTSPKPEAEPQGAGDVWTWTALDRDTKLIISYQVGDRSADTADEFLADLRSRLANPVQPVTDGRKIYLEAVDNAVVIDTDFAQLIKIYGGDIGQDSSHGYSPAKYTSIQKRPLAGTPVETDISISHERRNLSISVGTVRSTPLISAFGQKLAYRVHMLSLFFLRHNFVRIHESLDVTPAIAAGLSKEVRDIEWIVDLIDARTPTPDRPKVYRKRISN